MNFGLRSMMTVWSPSSSRRSSSAPPAKDTRAKFMMAVSMPAMTSGSTSAPSERLAWVSAHADAGVPCVAIEPQGSVGRTCPIAGTGSLTADLRTAGGAKLHARAEGSPAILAESRGLRGDWLRGLRARRRSCVSGRSDRRWRSVGPEFRGIFGAVFKGHHGPPVPRESQSAYDDTPGQPHHGGSQPREDATA